MLNYLFINPMLFALWLAALLVAITVHEFAHAWAADRLGDPTARLAGRLTLNPLAHLDPIGTLTLLLFHFGWGKPVPVDDYNLQHPRRDSAIISFAGPAANLLLALALSIFIRLALLFFGVEAILLELILTPFVSLAVTLAVFNLLPIPPLDGGKILIGLLPAKLANEWEEILNQYSFIIIILLLVPLFGSSLVNILITPIIRLIMSVLLPNAPLI